MIELIKDISEILFFSYFIYFLSSWLKKNNCSYLLLYFYSYCALFCLTLLINLTTINFFIIYFLPIFLLLLIIFHQDILQKNFITGRHQFSQISNMQWLDHLIRVSLYAFNKNQSIFCVIENQYDIKSFFETKYIFNSSLDYQLLTLVIESNNFDYNKLIWCNAQGTLIGINADIKINRSSIDSTKEMPIWQQEALLLTLKTDTIFFKTDPITRSFDVIVKGAIYKNISSHHIISLIQKHVGTHKGELAHDPQKPIFKQHHS